MKSIHMYFLIIAFSLFSCELQPTEKEINPNEKGDIDLSLASEKVVSASNNFGIDIFRLLLEDEPANKNVFISPVSISLALAMTYNGANNDTEDSMAYALRMDHLLPEEINTAYKELSEGLTSADANVLLDIANSIWYRQGFNVEQEFLNINSTYYNSEVRGLDFGAPESSSTLGRGIRHKPPGNDLSGYSQWRCRF